MSVPDETGKRLAVERRSLHFRREQKKLFFLFLCVCCGVSGRSVLCSPPAAAAASRHLGKLGKDKERGGGVEKPRQGAQLRCVVCSHFFSLVVVARLSCLQPLLPSVFLLVSTEYKYLFFFFFK